MTPLPSVSVIIPVLNAERDIRTALTTLLAMDYPRELLEVIVVDNGSTDRTREVVQEFPVTLMVEERAGNAYIARNAALPRATGDLVAFTDGDCIIDPQWLRAAVIAMQQEKADMVGGNILFTFPAGLSAACIFDSLVHLRNDRSIARRGCAVTANLIVKASLFKVVGFLPDEEPVAGDFIWTANAVARGFKIVYAPHAIVHHPARGLRSLVRKTYSIGRVYAFQRRMAPPLNAGGRPVLRLLWSYVPPNPNFIRRLLHERGTQEMRKKFLSVWLVSYLHSIVWATGALISLAAGSRRS
jgi:glycosyltransferase involved in cell wall biosynthesis